MGLIDQTFLLVLQAAMASRKRRYRSLTPGRGGIGAASATELATNLNHDSPPSEMGPPPT